jgi:hypothetical protein
MIRDDDIGLDILSRRSHSSAPLNPFDAVRARIAAVDLALVGLRPVVQVAPALCVSCKLRNFNLMPLRCALQFPGSHFHSHFFGIVQGFLRPTATFSFLHTRGFHSVSAPTLCCCLWDIHIRTECDLVLLLPCA